MGDLYGAPARECRAQPLPHGLNLFRGHRNGLPEAGSEPGLSDAETLGERRGGIESVPQIDEVHVALEERLTHRCARLCPGGDPLLRHTGERSEEHTSELQSRV